MRLVFLNRCYWPDTEATGQLLTDLAEHLAIDHDVHVVCGQPNSPKAGEAFVVSGIQVRGGVTIHRLKHARFAKRIPAGRLLNLVSFTRSAERYLRRTKLPTDVLISETDPFLLPLVGAKHCERIGAKWVCYLQDIYPDVAEAIGKAKPGRLTNTIRSRLRNAYRSAEVIVVLGTCMKDRLTRSPWSISHEKIELIPNWADCDSIEPLPILSNPFRRQHGLEDAFVVMHSGNMGLTQRLDVLIDATQQDPWPPRAVLMLVGDGAAREGLRLQATTLRHPDRVRFLPYQPRHLLGESLSAADVHVVSMHQATTGCLCPSKLYGIMAAGRPTLAVASAETDLCRTVTQFQIGGCCRPGDDAAIASQIAQWERQTPMLEEMGQRAREAALANFDRGIVLDRFSRLVSQLD